MHFSIPLLILSLFYILFICCIFFTKKKINTIENRIYTIIIIITLLGIILDILGIYAHLNLENTSIIRWLIVKFYMIYLLTFIFLMTIYILVIEKGRKKPENFHEKRKINKSIIIISIIYLVSAICNFFLPFHYFNSGNIVYIYGANATFLYIIMTIGILFWIFYILKNRNKISKKKILPILTFIIFVIPIVYLQYKNPELLLVTSLSAFVVVFMFHTIENPDLRLIEQLNLARDQAEKANQAKTEFLSNMSHEIRTPLNAIVGFSQVLGEDENIPEYAKEEVKDIMMASDSLLEIVNGILDISKIESGKLEIINIEYNLNKILEELVILTKTKIGEKSIELKTNFDLSIPPTLYGDHIRLKQIVLNLLTNSAKYTKEGFIEFKVSAVKKDDLCRLIISVEDSGTGIKREKIDKLFTKFERLGVERNTTVEGTGLGLAITKKLVELMHGQIVVQSVYGKGSKFTVAIDQKIIFKQETKEEEKTVSLEKLNIAGKKVLIVDDNTLNLKVASTLLRKYKIEVDTAQSGYECIEKIESGEAYDLILMDDMMPKMTGVETLKKLIEKENFKIPTIALTANAISGMREKYLSEGFSDYLSKPISKEELNRVIDKFFNRK